MDKFYPRLLVERFPECFRFYAAVLPELAGAKLIKGDENAHYANWDVDDDAVLVLFDRAAMAETVGRSELPAQAGPAQDTVMFVSRVDDVEAAFELCLRHGATAVVGPTDRSQWGPNLRTAHVRDPEGNLLELQSY
jgi:catechol 2,3-dioxygenase-like lactoylglutathione lyase family enzyme